MSQLDGIGEHALRDPRAQPPLGDHVDVPLQEVLDIHQQAAEIEQAAIRLEVDQEVDIAEFCGITASDRSEHPNPRRPTGARDLDDLVAALAQLRQCRSGQLVDITNRGARLTLTPEELAQRWGIHPESLRDAGGEFPQRK